MGDPTRKTAEIWTCDEMKKKLHELIRAHVQDVDVAERLEHALGDMYAYKATSKLLLIHD
jgi:hypothetical protein